MKILLVDDHVLFREGVALLLRPLVPDADVTEAGTCEEALRLVSESGGVDLVLMDLNLPGMPGMEGIALLRERYPSIPVVALSSNDDMQTVLGALDAGAMGFIPKSSSSGVLNGALKLIMAGGIYLPPSVFLAERQLPDSTTHVVQAGVDRSKPSVAPSALGLTPRQADVLYLILQGKSAKIICRELGLSSSTVKIHTSAVLRALNVTTRTQAVIAAGKMGVTFGAGGSQ